MDDVVDGYYNENMHILFRIIWHTSEKKTEGRKLVLDDIYTHTYMYSSRGPRKQEKNEVFEMGTARKQTKQNNALGGL